MCLFNGNPAKASARLQTWQFDTTQNRLFFSTETGVQPKVKLLEEPKRLIVDLPGIVSEDTLGNQLVGGVVRAVRVIQLDAETTRIELELDADYAPDPQKIKVWGLTNQQWIVQLPSAQPSAEESPAVEAIAGAKSIDLFEPPPIPRHPLASNETSLNDENSDIGSAIPEPSPTSPLPPLLSRNQVSHADVSGTATLLRRVVSTSEGFFLQTQGSAPAIQVYRTRDTNQGRQLVIDVMNTMIDPALTGDAIPSGVYGVRRWQVAQFRTTPPAVRITLSLDQVSPNWQVVTLQQGGVLLTPVGISANQIPNPPTTVVLPTIRNAPGRGGPPAPRVATPPAVPPRTASFARISAPPPITSPQTVEDPAPNLAQTAPVSPPPQRQQVMVMIDPGHGGVDPGAVGIGGLQEKGVVMAVALHVAALLQRQGVMVQMTRQADQTVDLQPRVDMAEAANATIFVSIHANAVNMQRPEVNGVETYYYSDAGARLANVLHRRVMSSMAMNDRGIKQARFFVLRRTSMPAALIEIGFVTGAADAPKLRDAAWQAQMGQAIATGILDYIQAGQ